MRRVAKHYTIFLALIFLVAVDQLSKYIIRSDGYRSEFYVCNSNIAFGIPMASFWFWTLSVIIVLIVSMTFGKALKEDQSGGRWLKNGLKYLPFVLILAGALSNMLDRFERGCVVDFIDLGTRLPAGMVWPLFNFADCFIVFGAFLWLVKFRKM